jgi:hypothetical protein
VSNAITIAYYGAPLSTAYDIIKSRNSASIYPPLALTNLLNALLWTAYGFVSPMHLGVISKTKHNSGQLWTVRTSQGLLLGLDTCRRNW